MGRMAKKTMVLLAAVFLGGCLVPEKFNASITVKPDGGYTYRYDGTAVHYMAAAAIRKQGSLSSKDDAGLAREAEKAAGNPGVKKIRYTGNGRYDLTIDQDLKAGQQPQTLKIFTFTQDREGIYTIGAAALKPKERDELRSLDIRTNGRFEVVLPANAKVLSQNASSVPGLLSKSYGWKIGSAEEQPSIRFTLTP